MREYVALVLETVTKYRLHNAELNMRHDIESSEENIAFEIINGTTSFLRFSLSIGDDIKCHKLAWVAPRARVNKRYAI